MPVYLQLLPVPNYTAQWQRQRYVRNLPKVSTQWRPGHESNRRADNVNAKSYALPVTYHTTHRLDCDYIGFVVYAGSKCQG